MNSRHGVSESVIKKRLVAPYFVKIGSRHVYSAETAGPKNKPAADFSSSGTTIRNGIFLHQLFRFQKFSDIYQAFVYRHEAFKKIFIQFHRFFAVF